MATSKLPQLATLAGGRAHLDTPVEQFKSWDDYKVMCLAAPKVAITLKEGGGEVTLACSRKLLRDFSPKFRAMEANGQSSLEFDLGIEVNSIASAFSQLYDMMQSGGLHVPVSGDVSFVRLIEMYVLADFLDVPVAKRWIEVFAQAKVQALRTTWLNDYITATVVQNIPQPQQDFVHYPITRPSRMEVQVHQLLDIQNACLLACSNPRAQLIQPREFAILVADYCPAALYYRLEGAGQLQPLFINLIGFFRSWRSRASRHGNAGQNRNDDDQGEDDDSDDDDDDN